MFGLLSSSQIYGLQQAHHDHANTVPTIGKSSKSNSNSKHRRSLSSVSESGKESKFFATISSMHGMKSPTNFIEKFLKSELLNGYDTLKNYKNYQQSASAASNSACARGAYTKLHPGSHESNYNPQSSTADTERPLTGFNCLHGSYRSSCDSEFYEAINVSNQNSNAMTIKCSKNLLAEPPQTQAPATLQNYQKLPECIHDLPASTALGVDGSSSLSSGASSGEFNSDTTTTTNGSTTTLPLLNTPVSNLYKKLSFGSRNSKSIDVAQAPSQPPVAAQSSEVPSDNSTSSISTTTTNSSTSTNDKSVDLQRSSSASSTGECIGSSSNRERKKSNNNLLDTLSLASTANGANVTPERIQRRKLLQMISNYELQNKLLQRELAKEKRRRVEELACVVKSLLCFESKLKTDMKSVNQRLLEKDNEICRLVRQNRALRKKLLRLKKIDLDRDEGVVEDAGADDEEQQRLEGATSEEKMKLISDKDLLEDCLVLEALQCINCRKQFYDIDLKEIWTQTTAKDGNRKNDDHTTEHGSSSDDTASSSFYGARRSVRYTSKRTAGTFRDYMRSRSMNIDDPSLEQNSEENTSTISRDDSQTSYEKINIFSRTIERMHGLKADSERDSEQDTIGSNRSVTRVANKVNDNKSRHSVGTRNNKAQPIDDDDGIFSPSQYEDIEVDPKSEPANRSLTIVQRRTTEFSEASPKQVYETSTDDWYASASDPEEIGVDPATSKPYGHGAVNPVLECVNQILLQQSMEESGPERPTTLDIPSSSPQTRQSQQYLVQKSPNQLEVNGNLPRRSSLSGTRNGTLTRKRVHFSTKNSMVHVPRNDDVDDDELAVDIHTEMISSIQQQQVVYHSMDYFSPSPQQNKQHISPSPGAMVETDRLDTLNYESIYSNEYEPIGSEQGSSNLYVDMEITTKTVASPNLSADLKMTKMPPALPPKPANLLKFKKSLQQLDEMPDEHLQQQEYATSPSTITGASEPDYCSISEVNVAITSVQTVADIHKAPESEADQESQTQTIIDDAPVSELDLELATMNSDDTCAASQKTEEIEEMFADVPKLPNVAAIIAPKNPKYQQAQQSDYLVMAPKLSGSTSSSNLTLQNSPKFQLNASSNLTPSKSGGMLNTPKESPKAVSNLLKLQLHMATTPTQSMQPQQYKRKHMPNILAEINKRMSLPNSPTTPTKLLTPTKSKSNTSLQKSAEDLTPPNLPLQAEFDWYNLDAEYGKAPLNQPDLLKVTCDNISGCNKLEEIHEDHESVVAAADEYNLDEEFSLASDKPDVLLEQDPPPISPKDTAKLEGFVARAAICEAINFPLICENSPLVVAAPTSKAKKMKKNLANFEKFIEGSGLSTKPLPNRRKIYFSGPFV